MIQSAYDRMIENIRQEALGFVSDAQRRFMAGTNQAESFLPDKTDHSSRIALLDIFIEAAIGFLVSTICTYANAHEKTEDLVIKGVQRKFKIAREMTKKGSDSVIQA